MDKGRTQNQIIKKKKYSVAVERIKIELQMKPKSFFASNYLFVEVYQIKERKKRRKRSLNKKEVDN